MQLQNHSASSKGMMVALLALAMVIILALYMTGTLSGLLQGTLLLYSQRSTLFLRTFWLDSPTHHLYLFPSHRDVLRYSCLSKICQLDIYHLNFLDYCSLGLGHFIFHIPQFGHSLTSS